MLLPLLLLPHSMPWVFTYNDWSAGTEYDWMAQAAVTSAIEVWPARCAAGLCRGFGVGCGSRTSEIPPCTFCGPLLHAQSPPAIDRPALPNWPQVGRVKPHCMFTGSTESPMYRWLASKGITLILVR